MPAQPLASQGQPLNVAQQRVAVADPMPSPGYRKEAELIVQEEKEAKSRMPNYKGLENFRLIEKMGE